MPSDLTTSTSTEAHAAGATDTLVSWAERQGLDGPALRDAIVADHAAIVDEAAGDLARLYGLSKRRLVSEAPAVDFLLAGCDLAALLAHVRAHAGTGGPSIERRLSQAIVYARSGDGYTRIWRDLQDRAGALAGPEGRERAHRNAVTELLSAEREVRAESLDRAHWRRRPTARLARACARPRGRRSSPARRRAAGTRSGSDPGDGPGEPPSSARPSRGGRR